MRPLPKTYVHSSKNICARFTSSSNSLQHMSSKTHVHSLFFILVKSLHSYQRCSITETTKQLLFILLETTSKHIFVIKTYMHTSFVDFILASKHICTPFHWFYTNYKTHMHIFSYFMFTYMHTYETPYIRVKPKNLTLIKLKLV